MDIPNYNRLPAWFFDTSNPHRLEPSVNVRSQSRFSFEPLPLADVLVLGNVDVVIEMFIRPEDIFLVKIELARRLSPDRFQITFLTEATFTAALVIDERLAGLAFLF